MSIEDPVYSGSVPSVASDRSGYLDLELSDTERGSDFFAPPREESPSDDFDRGADFIAFNTRDVGMAAPIDCISEEDARLDEELKKGDNEDDETWARRFLSVLRRRGSCGS